MTATTGDTLLDRYFLRELVGSGGMADVYMAWDKLRSVKMAVKVLRRDLGSSSRFFQQFAKEAEILNKLEHPNIVRLYEFDKDGDTAFIVMDWVDGSNLRQVITNPKRGLTLVDISRILDSVCSALNFAHQSRIYHCDIKPANIMLHLDGRVLLTDFGVAHLADETGGGGTPLYMAPEQFTRGAIDSRTDVYALGITLYEILSGGKVPFRGVSTNSQGSTTRERIAWEHLNLPMPSLAQHNPRISPALEKVVNTAIDKDPDRRFSSTLAFRDAFEKARAVSGEIVDTTTQVLLNDLKTLASASASAAAGVISAAARAMPKPVPNEAPTRKSTPPAGRNLPPAAVGKPHLSKLPSTSAKGPYLFCRSGQWAGQMLAVPLGEMVIGRGSQCNLKVNETSVSRRHATIICTKRGVYVRDDGSSLGTYVNGTRINGPVMLRDRDVIQIGYQQVFEFRVK